MLPFLLRLALILSKSGNKINEIEHVNIAIAKKEYIYCITRQIIFRTMRNFYTPKEVVCARAVWSIWLEKDASLIHCVLQGGLANVPV